MSSSLHYRPLPCSRVLGSEQAFAARFPSASLQSIHGDAPYNLLGTPSGSRYADFEDVTFGPPEWDLALFGPDAARLYDPAAAKAGVRTLDPEVMRVMDTARARFRSWSVSSSCPSCRCWLRAASDRRAMARPPVRRRIGRGLSSSRGTVARVTFEAAVEVGIFAFQSHEGGSADVRAALEQRGVAPWLAQRLTVYLPIAFGRLLYEGAVTMSDAMLDGTRERRLDDDPVWRAAEERARRAVRAEIERIGLMSAEVAAVNQALHGGSRLEDLVLGPVALLEPLLPEESGHGGLPSPLEAFRAFLGGHRFPVDESGRTGSLRIDARVFPRQAGDKVSLQTDFIVADARLSASYLIESFAGWSSTWQDALNQTIQKFERGSLHVLIASLLDRSSCSDQVTWERVEHPGGAFDACLGAQLTLYAASPAPGLGPLLDALYVALRGVELSRAIHGLRIFTSLTAGKPTTTEVLLDNEPWPAGESLARSAEWPVAQDLVGARLFLLLVPVAD